jgi:hypothetical protein
VGIGEKKSTNTGGGNGLIIIYGGTVGTDYCNGVATDREQAFYVSGADQTFTVPTGVTCVLAKMWGAGGGGASGERGHYNGGAGGFSQGELTVTAGSDLTIIVGEGGDKGLIKSPTSAAYGGGGAGFANNSVYGNGGGGGRSAIRSDSTELLTAGGGGGAGGSSGNDYPFSMDNYGGAGGGTTGEAGGRYDQSISYSQGGTQSTAGYNGSQYTGGSNTSNGTGGGGGYYGGGAGYGGNSNFSGGGGGSGYCATSGTANCFTLAGNKTNPPMMNDPDYINGIATGGIHGGGVSSGLGGSATGEDGKPGLVILKWKAP